MDACTPRNDKITSRTDVKGYASEMATLATPAAVSSSENGFTGDVGVDDDCETPVPTRIPRMCFSVKHILPAGASGGGGGK